MKSRISSDYAKPILDFAKRHGDRIDHGDMEILHIPVWFRQNEKGGVEMLEFEDLDKEIQDKYRERYSEEGLKKSKEALERSINKFYGR